ncbi:MAG: ABC transporter ATP-binding protein [Puniceicoccaceae bacterium]|nr:MAG: ABC transporter ATP-binding protein [Puniceicoccaceae bacterium]
MANHPPSASAPLIELEDVTRTYAMGDHVVRALDGVSLTIHEGEFIAIVGPSGSGKSTLMHLLGFMDEPSGGVMRFEGEDVSRIGSGRRAAYRSEKIGFVFQAFNLLPRLNVLDNVLLPLSYHRGTIDKSRRHAEQALERVGLSGRAGHRPGQLSGGERQRVAIARALINQPRLILADEPTGNLDSRNVERILGLFDQLHQEGQTIILVTHDAGVAAHARTQVHMLDGRIQDPASLETAAR